MAVSRSLKLSSAGKDQVERALTDKKWSIEDLAIAAGVQRATATNFRGATKGVDRKNFVKFCEVLGLDWESVCEKAIAPPETPIAPSFTPSEPDDALFQQVREHCRQKILNQHSRMRLLSGEEIGVDQLYVDVWLLNRPEHKLYKSPESLQKTFDVKNDRLALGRRIGDRTRGFDVARANAKLLILGKPGAGKTTFLKHLAVDWCEGKFQPDLIAVLIELRRIQDRRWNLLDRVDKELGLENWKQFTVLKEQIKDFTKHILELEDQIRALKKQIANHKEQVEKLPLTQALVQEEQERRRKHIADLRKQVENLLLIQGEQERQVKELRPQLEALPLQNLLKKGKILVLMDGLDEVSTSQLRQTVQNQLCEVAQDYPENRLILTCRTQIMESIPDGFTPVEVADFSELQVQQFVQNWFIATGKSRAEVAQQQKAFNNAINQNPDLKELMVTPVLLSLICLVLQDSGEIPSQKSWLYQQGIKLLLSKWNGDKQIEGWEVGSETYRQLNLEQKEALLTEIAARKFENPKNFVLFQQEGIAAQITEFLHLANCKEGVAVLKAIEAQHGLLIERADELWSFSHFTFQEYFTVRWLAQLPSEQLAPKIANRQWQEVVKQIVKSQQPADHLAQLIKQAIDQSIADEPKLQKFLTWVLQKSESVLVNYKTVTSRKFYLECALALTATLARTRACACDLIRASDPALSHARALKLELAPDLDLVHNLDSAPDPVPALDLDLVLNLALTLALARDLAHVVTFDRTRAQILNQTRAQVFDRALIHTRNSELMIKLQQLEAALPLPSFCITDWEGFQLWWQVDGLRWNEQLRQIMIEHRDIGHDWQFTDAETQQLQRYDNANKFLVELMQIEGAVSDDVRAEIEDSLLLPWEELQRRQS